MAQTTKARAKGGAKATIDHDEIRRWVEERGGRPAVVKRTATGRQPGILRVDFPGFSGEQSLEEIEWDEWLERFDTANLAFLYQDETGSGRPSRFNKLVSRDTVDIGEGSKRSAKRASNGRRGRRAAGTRAGATQKRGTRARASGASRGRRGRPSAASRTQSAGQRGSSRNQRGPKRGSKRGQRATSRGPSRTQRPGKRAAKRRSGVKRRGGKSR